MYLYSPDKIDRERANHQAVIQGADDIDVKRIENLGELAFEQFCREYLPVEMWGAKRKGNSTVQSRELLRARFPSIRIRNGREDVEGRFSISPSEPAGNDPDDDIIVMVWHRDNEDALILIG